jgi:hypothetical protein
MLINKVPVQVIHRASCRSFFDLGIIEARFTVITHIIDIVGTRDIWFGSEISSICKLRHPQYIGSHYSLKCISIHLPEPLIHIMRIISHQEGKITNDHKSGDMIAISCMFDNLENMIDTVHLEWTIFRPPEPLG